jgi:ribosomal protein L40E
MHCQTCGTELPADARFCIECGATIAPANTGATVQLTGATAIACRSCGAANPDFATYCVRCGQELTALATAATLGGSQSLARGAAPMAAGTRSAQRRRRQRGRGGVGLIFLFGLAAFFLLKIPLWPGILVLIGLVAFAGQAMSGRYYQAISSVIWLFGISFLMIVPRLWWPGILVIVGLNMLLDMLRRRQRWP